ncbi:hypothetical protein [Halococcus salifodinae]|uniref:hypothetical protein n=1 Tax=Halococcus salifodinae TaxID=36738 RepID=UPI00137578C0|nr:hypothetical protein [Halococcus salifodinae]
MSSTRIEALLEEVQAAFDQAASSSSSRGARNCKITIAAASMIPATEVAGPRRMCLP